MDSERMELLLLAKSIEGQLTFVSGADLTIAERDKVSGAQHHVRGLITLLSRPDAGQRGVDSESSPLSATPAAPRASDLARHAPRPAAQKSSPATTPSRPAPGPAPHDPMLASTPRGDR